MTLSLFTYHFLHYTYSVYLLILTLHLLYLLILTLHILYLLLLTLHLLCILTNTYITPTLYTY